MTSILAVDLGKTGCRVALTAGERRVEADGAGAPGLAAPGGAALAEAAILAVAAPLLRAHGVAILDAAGVGAAGALAAPEAARDLAGRLCVSLPAHTVAIASDAATSHAGALGGEPGVVLAVGTGAVAIAVGADGAMHRADGWGPWLGDEGGGAWLGLHGLRAALHAHDGGPPTALQHLAAARFGPLTGLSARIEGDAHPPRLAAQFAPDILAAAADGDRVAADLLRRATTALARSVKTVAAKLAGDGPVPFAIVGGLAGIGAALTDPLRDAAPALRPVPAQGAALDGALLLATRTDTIHERGVQRATAPPGGTERLDRLATEAVRPDLHDLDQRTPAQIVSLVLEAERAAQGALARAVATLGASAEAVAARMLGGGRLFYLGAGTPGRLAVLDAAELAPTYNAPPGLVVALLAGGPSAMIDAAEGAEDDSDAAGAALDAHDLRAGDAVVGITASGRTPYVVGGLRHARGRGALAVAIVNNAASEAAAVADIAVEILTGAEIVAGSTRMTAGTTQKVALNAISTAAMVALGKTYGTYMVDVRATNEKLRRRALRMVQQVSGTDAATAAATLAQAGGRVKPAIVALLAGIGVPEAEERLLRAAGRVRDALAARNHTRG